MTPGQANVDSRAGKEGLGSWWVEQRLAGKAGEHAVHPSPYP